MKSPNERESAILKYWQENNIFQKSLEKGGQPFRYYDGPPYATGLPHFGHIVPTAVKDVIPRYKTMQGFHVPRTWGWDCHGLPIENMVEKQLGFKGKKDIEQYGVGKFNTAARESVFGYREDWKNIIPRLGRWVNMDDDYRTMDASFMESGLWAFKTLWEKGLVYEGYKVMPWCPHCETVLSNNEVSEGYEDITDLSAYVKFPIIDGEYKGVSLIAWTTTPWTLPGNVALAVNANLEYTVVQLDNEKIIILKSAVEKLSVLLKDKSTLSVESEISGKDLVDLKYEPPFSYFPKEKNAYQVYAADFVTDTDGTGIVHIAPAFGDDDMKLAQANKLPVIKHVGTTGEFSEEVQDLKGQVKPKEDPQKADVDVIKYLAHHNKLLAKEKYTHAYPHCWRCKTPLLNYATSSWFIKTTSIKDRMIEENNKTVWHPDEIGHKRLSAWLENMRDWAVSRSRFWGTPLPVWKGEKTGTTICLGSVSDIREKTRRNIYTFLRHGEAEHLLTNVMSSHLEYAEKHGLTEKGKKEVVEAVDRLIAENNVPTIIYYSPIRRTRETAEMIHDLFKEKKRIEINIVADDHLLEQNFGDLDGQTRDVLKPYRSTRHDLLFQKLPNGESIEDVRLRMGQFLYDIDAKHNQENILCITHEGVAYGAQNIARGDSKESMEKSDSHPEYCLPTGQYMMVDFANVPHNSEYELDLHRPYIDEVTFIFEDEMYKRLPEVLDVWYDAGSMPFASVHYPFENEEKFHETLPVDFVAEGLDQTRGWFYHMLVMSVALFDKSPFKHVLVNGLVLASDGKKMSKSLKNYPDLMPIAEQYGADALRYLFLSSQAVRAEEYAFAEKSLTEVNNKLFNKITNTISFIEMYGVKGSLPTLHTDNALDSWIAILLENLLREVTDNMEDYLIDKATRPIMDFVEELSTWYVRRSRDRFKDAKEAKVVTENLLYILLTLSKIMAPFTPFMAEEMYLFIKDFSTAELKESVHLETWPENISISLGGREEILAKMQKTREAIETGLAERNKEGIKVRQPLASFTVPGEMYDQLHHDIIEDELNVKKVIQGEIQEAFKLDTNITEDLRLEGVVRDITREIQAERKNMNLVPEDKVEVVVYTDKVDIKNGLEGIYSIVGATKITVEVVDEKVDSKVVVKKA